MDRNRFNAELRALLTEIPSVDRALPSTGLNYINGDAGSDQTGEIAL
jgi:hypothetical protein